MEAFAGESQARNKYTYFASKAKKEVEERNEEYSRLWKVTWELRLLNRKEKIYLKKVEKKKAKFDKKRKKLEEDLIPRCKGIKM